MCTRSCPYVEHRTRCPMPVYQPPAGLIRRAALVLRMDLEISTTISSNRKYSGGVLGPNGLIYFVPHDADNIGVLNPSTDTFITIDIHTCTYTYRER